MSEVNRFENLQTFNHPCGADGHQFRHQCDLLQYRTTDVHRRQHFEGTLIAAAVALLVANFVPLEAIATMGSAGFLLLFLAVNIAIVRLARETGSRAWISGLAALSMAIALIVLCIEVDENPATRNHLWILVGMILVSFGIEIVYRMITGRGTHLVRKGAKDGTETHSSEDR